MKIPFNKPYLTGKEVHYIYEAIYNGHISGNGGFTKKCQTFFEEYCGFKKCLLTTSCTDALEMCALLLDIQPGDEVIVPSYTFVSTALAFVRQGAKIVFADSRTDHPGLNEDTLEDLITDKTKVIVPVHYAGVACDMEKIMNIANKHDIYVVEDAAQAIDSYYKGQHLGTFGHLSAFSFHETKNIQSGEGGLLAINDEQFIDRAEILWEKGTNRAEFFRGEVNKYGWVDTGSSFLPADVIAGFLYAQLEHLEVIQQKRKYIFNLYKEQLKDLNEINIPIIPGYATVNGHMFYIICPSTEFRQALINTLKEEGIHSVFHYLSLHQSEFAQKRGWNNQHLPMSDLYSDRLLRLPLYYELTEADVKKITSLITTFTKKYHEDIAYCN